MGKNTRGSKEYSKLQQILHENRKLKREIAILRKHISKIDIERYSYVSDIVKEFYKIEDEKEQPNIDIKNIEKLKKNWECKVCGTGYLEIVIYDKIGSPWYFRRCNNLKCRHRTKSQSYNEEVKGIFNDGMYKM